MNNLLRIPITWHSSIPTKARYRLCSDFGTQRSSRYASPEKKSGQAVPKSCASIWLSDTWNAHNEDCNYSPIKAPFLATKARSLTKNYVFLSYYFVVLW